MRRFAVLGPGGVGGFVAAALQRAGEDVVVVAREETAAAIDAGGLRVQSVRLGDFTAHPRTATELAPSDDVDVLVVATKATTLEPALARVTAEPALVAPLLNGVEHIAVLRRRFGAQRVVAATIRIESDRPAPGEIVQTSPFLRIDLAADDLAIHPAMTAVAERLHAAGIPARIESSEAQALWSKLVRLCALACTTSAADRPIGFIRSDPEWRATLIACIEEATAVANAEGAQIDAAGRVGELDEAHPGLGSSMQRDIAAGRAPELDAIAGAVLRAGARHGLACPTIARLADMIAARAGVPALERL